MVVQGVGKLYGWKWLKAAKHCTCDDARSVVGVEATGRSVFEKDNTNGSMQDFDWREGWNDVENDFGCCVLDGGQDDC